MCGQPLNNPKLLTEHRGSLCGYPYSIENLILKIRCLKTYYLYNGMPYYFERWSLYYNYAVTLVLFSVNEMLKQRGMAWKCCHFDEIFVTDYSGSCHSLRTPSMTHALTLQLHHCDELFVTACEENFISMKTFPSECILVPGLVT